MTTDGKDEGTAQEEGDDALWRLLERAPRPGPVSPYFARRVLREVALLEEVRPVTSGASDWLARTWQAWRHQPRRAFAVALAAVAILVVGGVGLSAWRSPAPVIARAEPAVPADATLTPDAVANFAPDPQPTIALLTEPVVTAQDVEVIADLDNLLSREESRLWTEDDTARF